MDREDDVFEGLNEAELRQKVRRRVGDDQTRCYDIASFTGSMKSATARTADSTTDAY